MSTADTRTVVVEREFAHAPAKVWRALTEGPLLAEWLMQNDFAPQAGRGFQFRDAPVPQWDGIIAGAVLSVDPPNSLSYTWNSAGLESVVTWTLTPTATGTHLRMEQSGFRADQERAFKGAAYGWQKYLGQLETTLGQLETTLNEAQL